MLLHKRGFSLLEVLISSSLALMVLGVAYLLYAGAFRKAVLFSEIGDRYNQIDLCCRFLSSDLSGSASEGVFWDGSQRALAVFAVQGQERSVSRFWGARPRCYRWRDLSLIRFIPRKESFSEQIPAWSNEQFAGLGGSQDVVAHKFSDVKSFELQTFDRGWSFTLECSVLKADGRQSDLVVKKVVCSCL